MLDYLKHHTALCERISDNPAYSLDRMIVNAKHCHYEDLRAIIDWMKRQGAVMGNDFNSYEDEYENTGLHWLKTRWVQLCLGFTFKGEHDQKKDFCMKIWKGY